MIALPSVSVIVLTFRPGGLDLLFSGLAEQDYAGDWELLLVDDLWNPNRCGAVREAGECWPLKHAQRALHLHPGCVVGPGVCTSARARNRALRAARGNLLIWLSDYSAIRSDWIRQHVTAHWQIEQPRAVVCGAHFNTHLPEFAPDVLARQDAEGLIDPFASPLREKLSLFAEPLSAEQAFSLDLTLGHDPATLYDAERPDDYFAMTLKNDSMRRAPLLEIGGFDERFDRLACCMYQDTELALRLATAGAMFLRSKQPMTRNLVIRLALRHLRKPQSADVVDAMMSETAARCARGELQPVEGGLL